MNRVPSFLVKWEPKSCVNTEVELVYHVVVVVVLVDRFFITLFSALEHSLRSYVILHE